MTKNMKTVIILSVIAILLAFMPFLLLKNAEFGGADDAGSQMIEKIEGDYTPWFTPVLEKYIGGEIPGEIESMFFCLQTGIGVGIIAFIMGRMVERKKWQRKEDDEKK